MRICVVGPSSRFFSGLAVHTVFLANALARRNDVSVILLRKLVPECLYPGREWVGGHAPTVDFAPGIPVFDGMDWHSPVSWVRAHRFLAKQEPDAVIMLWWSSAVAHMQLFLLASNRLRLRSKMILEMHEVLDPMEERILPVRLYARVAGRLLVRSGDVLTVHSSEVRSQVSRIYGVPAERVVVKPFGLYDGYHQSYDSERARRELGISERFVILAFGSIRKYKGLSFLVKAFSSLPESIANNSRLLIGGEDWGDDTEFWGLVESSPYRDKITVRPQLIPDGMIPKYFSAADLVALPYLRTAGSGVASIAMAYARPILTSDVGTMRELLADYPMARFAPAADSAALAAQLSDVYGTSVSGEMAPEVPSRDTWEDVVALYENIIAADPKRGRPKA